MRALNIIVGDTQGQIESIHDPYKDSLDNVLDSNIDNIMAKIVHTKSGPLRQNTSIIQLCKLQNVDVLQLSEDFGQVFSKRDKYSSFFTRAKSSPKLPPSIVLLDYSAINTRSISDD